MENFKPIDVVETGLDRLTWDLQNKENIEKLFTLFLNEVQRIEDTLLEIIDIKDIDSAEGVQLDNIGDILGVARMGMGDEGYREELRFQVVISTSNGTYKSIYNIIKNFTEATRIRITPSAIAFATLYVSGKENISSKLWNLLDQIKPAGTRWLIQSDFYDTALLFAWEKKQGDLESFQVTEDGVLYENLQVTEDGVNYEDFLIGEEGIIIDPQTIIDDRNQFFWEEPDIFYVTEDGESYEPLFLDEGAGTYPEFKVQAPYLEGYIPENVRPMTWEITQNTSKIETFEGLDELILSVENYINSVNNYNNIITFGGLDELVLSMENYINSVNNYNNI